MALMSAWLITGHKARLAQFDLESLQLLEKEKKTGDLTRRSKQAVLHLTYTELRITEMEEKIRELEAQLYNKPDGFQLSMARRQAPVHKSFIKRSSQGEFLLTRQSLDIPSHEQASLEVLVAEQGTSAMLGPDQFTASHSTGSYQRTGQETPERLRIRYAPLIKTLEKVCRETLSNYNFWPSERGYTTEGTGCAPAILLRPWKLFVAYETEIRNSLQNVDLLWNPARRGDGNDAVAVPLLMEDCE